MTIQSKTGRTFNDLDIGSMYAYAAPSPELAARQKEDRTRKTCDIHLKRIADHRKEYARQNGLEETYRHPDATEVAIVDRPGFASRYRDMLLRACLERDLKLSWDESVLYVEILVGSTEVPEPGACAQDWVDAAMLLNKLMVQGVEIAIQNISRHQEKA